MKSHCLGLWDTQFVLPLFVCFSFAITLSAQHCTLLIHCTVCPVSTVFLALSTLVCPSLGNGHFSDTGLPLGVATAIYFYTDHLRSFLNCLYSNGLCSSHLGQAEPYCHSQAHPQWNRKILDPGTSV